MHVSQKFLMHSMILSSGVEVFISGSLPSPSSVFESEEK